MPIIAASTKRDSHPDEYAIAVNKDSFNGEYNADSVVVTLSIALALYNSLELFLLIAATFKRWRGLYFWSLSVCNLGVILYTIGMLMGYFDLGVLWLGKTILDIGWILMIAFQSLVLYSRLGLLLDNQKILSGVKWMIITTSVVLLPTVCVLDFGNTYSNLETFPRAYFYIEHIQMTFITLQELIISFLYVWKTLALLKVISKKGTRSTVWQLFIINVIIIVMDVTLVVLQYKHFQLYQESIKAFVYSVKLRLELNILSKLVDLVHGNAQAKAARSMTLDAIDSNSFAGQAQSEMRQDLQEPEKSSGRSFASDDKSPMQYSTEAHRYAIPQKADPPSSGSGADDDDNDIGVTQVMSHNSRYSARTSGRESDVLYADFLRDLK